MLERVQAGEHFIVTKSGRPVAELGPVRTRTLDRSELIARWRNLPEVDAQALREDIDAALDSGL